MGGGPLGRTQRSRIRHRAMGRPKSIEAMRNATIQKRRPRKIRYRDAEWDLIVARARECRKPPARYVREVSLGVIPRARRNRIEEGIIHQLGRIGNNLNQIARLAQAAGHLPTADQLRSTLEEILALVRRIG